MIQRIQLVVQFGGFLCKPSGLLGVLRRQLRVALLQFCNFLALGFDDVVVLLPGGPAAIDGFGLHLQPVFTADCQQKITAQTIEGHLSVIGSAGLLRRVGQRDAQSFQRLFLCAQFYSGCLLFFFVAAEPRFPMDQPVSRFMLRRQGPVYKKKRPVPVYSKRRKSARNRYISTLMELCYHEGKSEFHMAPHLFLINSVLHPFGPVKFFQSDKSVNCRYFLRNDASPQGIFSLGLHKKAACPPPCASGSKRL